EHLVCVRVLLVQEDVVLGIQIDGDGDGHRAVDLVLDGEAMLHVPLRRRCTYARVPATAYASGVSAYRGAFSGLKQAGPPRRNSAMIRSLGLSTRRPFSRLKR